MPETYDELLGAMIRYLEDLKARGVRLVNVSPENLRALATSPRSSRREEAHDPPLPTSSHLGLAAGWKQQTANNKQQTAKTLLDAATRLQAFAELRARVMGCIKCPNLASSRKNVVFGVGNMNAELMFVGEAPGADEDQQGEPFVGAAGQLLTKMIQAMGLTRDSVYIANILKCRPDTPGQAYGNRKPTSEEMQTCIPWLHQQIDLIQPKVLVGLGATAIEGLLGKTIGIMRLRGQWHTFRDIPLMPTYHPAFLLRNQAMSEKRKVWEDLLQVMEKLALPVTDKQRGYFLQA